MEFLSRSNKELQYNKRVEGRRPSHNKTTKIKLTIMSTKNNRKNAAWLNNRNATKNAKVFNVTLYRDERGDFHAVGGESLVLNRKTDQWENVNTRDLTRFINKSGIKSL